VHKGLAFGAVVALVMAGCAQVEQRQRLTEPVGLVLRTPVGGAIATIIKDRDLPNAFGRADVYGRKVDAGFTQIIYRGRGLDGSVLVEQVDVDVRSNASTLTRRPVLYSRTQPAVASARESGVAYGTSRVVRVASPADEASMLLPEAAQFSVPKQKSLTLPTGQRIEFLAAEPHELTYRIVDRAK
jgi:hypothetical protein